MAAPVEVLLHADERERSLRDDARAGLTRRARRAQRVTIDALGLEVAFAALCLAAPA